MQYTNLIDCKEHLKIEQEFEDDDIIVTAYLNAAEKAVSNYCNDSFSGYTAENIPPDLQLGVYFLVTNFYLNRSPIAFAQAYKIPYTFDWLLEPYKNYVIV